MLGYPPIDEIPATLKSIAYFNGGLLFLCCNTSTNSYYRLILSISDKLIF